MKNRKGIIKINPVVVNLIEDDEDLAKALFTNFFPDEIVTHENGKTYIGKSPLFREIEDNETIPVYDFEVKWGYDGVFTFVGFHEIDVTKECDKLESENTSLKKSLNESYEGILGLHQKIVTLTDENQNLKSQLEKESKAHITEVRNLEKNLKNWKERFKLQEYQMFTTEYRDYSNFIRVNEELNETLKSRKTINDYKWLCEQERLERSINNPYNPIQFPTDDERKFEDICESFKVAHERFMNSVSQETIHKKLQFLKVGSNKLL